MLSITSASLYPNELKAAKYATFECNRFNEEFHALKDKF